MARDSQDLFRNEGVSIMILIENTGQEYDQETIQRGGLIYAKHKTWERGVAGLVAEVTKDMLYVQYCPPLRNVTNHFRIPAEELAAGEWEFRYSNDGMETIQKYPEEGEGNDSGSTDTELADEQREAV